MRKLKTSTHAADRGNPFCGMYGCFEHTTIIERGTEHMKTINILGTSQREQWHTIVNLLRQLGGDLDRKGRSDICDEIDRYIDFCEDIFDEMRKEGDAKE